MKASLNNWNDCDVVVMLPGLIRLPRPAVLNAGVQLACLPLSPPAVSQASQGSIATIVGWGHTNLRNRVEQPHWSRSSEILGSHWLRSGFCFAIKCDHNVEGPTLLRDQADGVLESSSLVDRIAEYNQQKARVKIISLEECQEQWGDTVAPLLSSQGQSLLS